MRRTGRRVPLEVALLEGKVLLSSAIGRDSPPHAVPCAGKHFINLSSKGSVFVAQRANRSRFVATITTTTEALLLPPKLPFLG
jgi:hypothetical protein